MMRPGQHNNNNKRNRNRNRRHSNQGGGGGGGGGNGGNRVYDSNGPDVKLRGTAQTIAEKYMQLARDAQSSGDSVMAESCYQHADHYYRIWLAAQPAGQPLQFSRRLAEEEFEDADDDQNDGDGEAQDNEGSDGGDAGDGGAVAEGQGEPQAEGEQQGFQPRNNQREFRPYNREGGGNRDNRDGGRDGNRDGGNRNFRQRWPRRNDRLGADGQPQAQGSEQAPEGQDKPERSERPERVDRIERVQDEPRESARAAEVSDSGDNWEAPSFLRRPVPTEVLEAAPVSSEDAPAPRRRGRPPKVAAAPVEPTPQDE